MMHSRLFSRQFVWAPFPVQHNGDKKFIHLSNIANTCVLLLLLTCTCIIHTCFTSVMHEYYCVSVIIHAYKYTNRITWIDLYSILNNLA